MKKTVIVYGNYSGIQINAIKYLSETVLDYTGKFPVCISHTEFKEDENSRYIFIGTKENNPYIKKLSEKKLTHREEYYIKVFNDNAIIEGSDEGGVLYGCIDFYGKYIVNYRNTHAKDYFKNIFENKLPDFEYSSYPLIRDRGLWTWGHVIYDYKGYIDSMVRLKMNTVIIWNDYVPVNAAEMIEYAHNSNIKIFWGFPWGWDTACDKIDIKSLDKLCDSVIEEYEKSYAKLGGDGIYFQSFTELSQETIGGILIAQAVTDFVNQTAEKLFKKHPTLELQFGLHATSVKERLDYIKNINPKITITWENCGAFPYDGIPQNIKNFDNTCDFTKKIISLRGENEKFGAVPKGFTGLDWSAFEHQGGRYYLGHSSEHMQADRLRRKENIWRYVQAYWLKNADKALEMIRLMQNESNGNICITALVEDGMLERRLYYPVALFAQMLWDCSAALSDIMCETALNSYVTFA